MDACKQLSEIIYKRCGSGQSKDQQERRKRRKTDNNDEISTEDDGIATEDDEAIEDDEISTESDELPTEDDAMDQQESTLVCNEINRRSVGKAIIKYCGHEGTENDRNTANLRRLLQAVISHIDQESPDTWRNAEVKIYDDNFDVYTIRAGDGEALFLATFDGMNSPQVVKTSRKRIESSQSKRRKCPIM